MISASGSDPLERGGKGTLILWVIQLMNDLDPETLADPTLIMLREPHLGGHLPSMKESEGGANGCEDFSRQTLERGDSEARSRRRNTEDLVSLLTLMQLVWLQR